MLIIRFTKYPLWIYLKIIISAYSTHCTVILWNKETIKTSKVIWYKTECFLCWYYPNGHYKTDSRQVEQYVSKVWIFISYFIWLYRDIMLFENADSDYRFASLWWYYFLLHIYLAILATCNITPAKINNIRFRLLF